MSYSDGCEAVAARIVVENGEEEGRRGETRRRKARRRRRRKGRKIERQRKRERVDESETEKERGVDVDDSHNRWRSIDPPSAALWNSSHQCQSHFTLIWICYYHIGAGIQN